MSQAHIYLSTLGSIHPQPPTPRLYKSSHPSDRVLPFLHALWSASNRLRLWTLNLLLFHKGYYRPRRAPLPIQSPTYLPPSFSHIHLQRSFASKMKGGSSDSIRLSATQLSRTSSHDLSFRTFILLLFFPYPPKACNYRVCCKTWLWVSISLFLITNSSHMHSVW